MDETVDSPWKRPNTVHKIRKLQIQKRALQDRLFEFDTPPKKLKQTKSRKSLPANITPSDTSSCGDDSTLMDLLGLRPIPGEGIPSSALSFSRLLSSPAKFTIPVHSSPTKVMTTGDSSSQVPLTSDYVMSPLKTFMTSGGSPSPSKDGRKTLVPRRLPLSPSFSLKSKSFSGKRIPLNDLLSPAEGGPGWRNSLCLDWSLKAGISVISPNSYGWTNDLKTSEESSGISAFVRCIDIEPPDNNSQHPSASSSQLDTSLGAQFHQCCLYWQHPSVPGLSMVPREAVKPIASVKPNGAKLPPIRFDQRLLDSMYSEWVEAVSSAFHLLKARQCPFFYVCTNTFTCLFCSAGTQGDEQIQIYITPTNRSFLELLRAKNINFTLPYSRPQGTVDLEDEDDDRLTEDSDFDEDEHKTSNSKVSPSTSAQYRLPKDSKSLSLLLIAGSDSVPFFTLLVSDKSLTVGNGGPFAGLPATILSPVAFHGATLKTLQVQQRSIKQEKLTLHSIDMKGPILPHVLHMLTSLLNKTVKSYKIKVKTIEPTVPFNVYANMNREQRREKPSAFDLQNLSDCGLKKEILEVFCTNDHCDTIQQMLEGKRGMYRWQ